MATNRYQQLLEKIFLDRYREGLTEFIFQRVDLETTAQQLSVNLPKNLGDVIYSVRYRTALPEAILDTQPDGMEWTIEGAGRAKYRFKLTPIHRILPNPQLVATKIPDATPELIVAHGLSDEQSLLAKVRYNRLLDIFLGITSYSLQNHLRTSVQGVGQVEIDEIYVGVDRHGCQYVVPVQAKAGSDQLSTVQTKQDLDCCAAKFPTLRCRPISAQFMADDVIALFELTIECDVVKLVDEKHYLLVPCSAISSEDLRTYSFRSPG